MSTIPHSPPFKGNNSVALRLLVESLRTNGWGRFQLRGNSMWPTLRDGWMVRIRAIPAPELRVGDIGAFVNREVLTVHRLIWKRTEGTAVKYIFQGDNSSVREQVEAGAVLGRVVAAEGEWNQPGVHQSIDVGGDERAFFYRNAFRCHARLVRHLPALEIPGAGGKPRPVYRLLRFAFRILERIISPRPSRS